MGAQKNRLIETVLLSTHNGSFEYPQHMFCLRNKKNNVQFHSPSYLEVYTLYSFIIEGELSKDSQVL